MRIKLPGAWNPARRPGDVVEYDGQRYRLVSVYRGSGGEELEVITEAEWRCLTVTLPMVVDPPDLLRGGPPVFTTDQMEKVFEKIKETLASDPKPQIFIVDSLGPPGLNDTNIKDILEHDEKMRRVGMIDLDKWTGGPRDINFAVGGGTAGKTMMVDVLKKRLGPDVKITFKPITMIDDLEAKRQGFYNEVLGIPYIPPDSPCVRELKQKMDWDNLTPEERTKAEQEFLRLLDSDKGKERLSEQAVEFIRRAGLLPPVPLEELLVGVCKTPPKAERQAINFAIQSSPEAQMKALTIDKSDVYPHVENEWYSLKFKAEQPALFVKLSKPITREVMTFVNKAKRGCGASVWMDLEANNPGLPELGDPKTVHLSDPLVTGDEVHIVWR